MLQSVTKSQFRQHYASLDGNIKGNKPRTKSLQLKRRLVSIIVLATLMFFAHQRLNTAVQQDYYTIEPLGVLGVQVKGLDLTKPIHPGTIDSLKQEVYHHKLVLFREQHLNEAQQLAFAGLFGKIKVTYENDKHPGVSKISNTDETDVNSVRFADSRYWHTDGVFTDPTPIFIMQHMKLVSSVCSTKFIDANKFLRDCASAEQIAKWDTASIRNTVKLKNMTSPWYDMIVNHPVTKQSTMMFQIAATKRKTRDALVFNRATPQEEVVAGYKSEYLEFTVDLMNALDNCRHHIYDHHWVDGDVIVLDNVALPHAASLGANLTAQEVGRRELWQTQIFNDLPVKKLHPYLINT